MLVRLRPRALGGVDHEQEEVDPGRAGHHRAHEALVPRHVDEREPAAVGQLERRVAEVDRDPALAAPRAAGRCPCRSAPGRARSCRGRCARRCRPVSALDDPRCGSERGRRRRRRRPRRPPVRERAHVEQQPPVADDADDGRLAGAERVGERLLDGAGEARQLGERQRAAADARRRSPRPRRRRPRPGARPGPARRSTGSASILRTGISRRARSGSSAS